MVYLPTPTCTTKKLQLNEGKYTMHPSFGYIYIVRNFHTMTSEPFATSPKKLVVESFNVCQGQSRPIGAGPNCF